MDRQTPDHGYTIASGSGELIMLLFKQTIQYQSSKDILLMQLTIFPYTDGQKKRYNQSNNSKNIQSRVMVLLHDTSSYCALQLYEVSFK